MNIYVNYIILYYMRLRKISDAAESSGSDSEDGVL
jgi:hypothetical protein